MDRVAALNFLKSLTRTELALLVAEAAEHWTTGDLTEGRTVYRLAECFAYRGIGEQRSESARLALIAYPIALEDFAGDDGVEQGGSCSNCGVEVYCVSKVAVCPICGGEALCT
ncbi:hypothetical protein [Variovorax paradoxus]|uniref:hypothetical protein n=1 Tax=Variovorax paradoxus TaxID=34073 RepID=UPI003D65CD82